MYFSNIEYHVITQLTKCEVKNQLVQEEQKINIIRGGLCQLNYFGE
jgi:hypothetical protein